MFLYTLKVRALATKTGRQAWHLRRRLSRLQRHTKTAMDLIREEVRGKSFVDIGCMWGVDGEYSFVAEQSGARSVIGVDVISPSAAFERKRRELGSKIEFIQGDGSLTAEGNVKVGDEVYEAKAVTLATGSVALPIPGTEFGGRVLDTWKAWSLDERPGRIAVVGAGASGAELASAYSKFGTEVLLIEMLDQILPAEDKDIAKVVERVFKKQGIEISTGTPVENVEAGDSSVKFTYGDNSAEVDYLCIAGGRSADTEGLGLDEAGVELAEGGRKIKVDEFQRTTNQKVFAIGDLVNQKALAHKASEEGVVAVETAAGVETHPVNQGLIVGATFCQPQVASVGLTEAQAKEAGHEIKVGKQKIAAEGAGIVYDDKDGLVKLVVDAKYGELLGAHVVGNRACDMIAELVATMELEGGYQELSRIVHPHPTVSEAVLDAARAVDGWAIHA
jgi:dihydrolipoamide dehydrogenase